MKTHHMLQNACNRLPFSGTCVYVYTHRVEAVYACVHWRNTKGLAELRVYITLVVNRCLKPLIWSKLHTTDKLYSILGCQVGIWAGGTHGHVVSNATHACVGENQNYGNKGSVDWDGLKWFLTHTYTCVICTAEGITFSWSFLPSAPAWIST